MVSAKAEAMSPRASARVSAIRVVMPIAWPVIIVTASLIFVGVVVLFVVMAAPLLHLDRCRGGTAVVGFIRFGLGVAVVGDGADEVGANGGVAWDGDAGVGVTAGAGG